MDPNATLEALRSAAAYVIATVDERDKEPDELPSAAHLCDLTEQAEELSTLFQALDGWLSNCGFLPKSWERV